MKEIKAFQCEKCLKFYLSQEEAMECEQQPSETAIYTVGDIIHLTTEIGGGLGTLNETYKVLEIDETGHYVEYHLGTEDEDGKWYESKVMVGNDRLTHSLSFHETLVCIACGQPLPDKYIEDEWGLTFCDELCQEALATDKE